MAEKECFHGDKVLDSASLQCERKRGMMVSGLACPTPISAAHIWTAEATVTESQPGGALVCGRPGGVKGGFGPLSAALEPAADP